MNYIFIALFLSCFLPLYSQVTTIQNGENRSQPLEGETGAPVLMNDSAESSFSWGVKIVHDGLSQSGKHQDSHLLHFINPSAQWDVSSLSGFEHTVIHMQFLGMYDFHHPLYYSPAQGVSNIAADNMFKLYQLGITKEYPAAGLSFYLGLFDFNSEFDTRESSADFLNPSHGIGVDISQSGAAGPSIFPNAAFALQAGYWCSENVKWLSAIIDAVPGEPGNPSKPGLYLSGKEGYILANELQLYSDVKDFSLGYAKSALGFWYYTAVSDHLIINDKSNNFGLYFNSEKYFQSPVPAFAGISAFARVGYANKKINSFGFYAGAGFTIYPGESMSCVQSIGYSTAYGAVTPDFRSITPGTKSFEMIHELTILFQPYGILTVQPDFQYVVNPLCGDGDVLFSGIRCIIEI